MDASERATANQRVVRRLLVAAVAMFGFGFALVPLYDVFCDITGINGKTGRIEAEAALSQRVDGNRTVTVEFLSSVRSDLAWDFRPAVKRVKVHPGEVTEVHYVARNRTGETIAGQAVPSLAPGLAAKYFNKTECFCFTRQTLGPNEEKLMPLRFVVDPDLPEEVGTVSLSYTFFHAESGEPAGKQAGVIEELQDTAGAASGAQL
ncbi:MAG TPA: cytochrome c oxidase assembly protein [Gammaproteobacteria bacterium]|nr:cytochrome c oxidase assembly protein [Gammaproteobacteria bacterium]